MYKYIPISPGTAVSAVLPHVAEVYKDIPNVPGTAISVALPHVAEVYKYIPISPGTAVSAVLPHVAEVYKDIPSVPGTAISAVLPLVVAGSVRVLLGALLELLHQLRHHGHVLHHVAALHRHPRGAERERLESRGRSPGGPLLLRVVRPQQLLHQVHRLHLHEPPVPPGPQGGLRAGWASPRLRRLPGRVYLRVVLGQLPS